jgi:hypothetical protein
MVRIWEEPPSGFDAPVPAYVVGATSPFASVMTSWFAVPPVHRVGLHAVVTPGPTARKTPPLTNDDERTSPRSVTATRGCDETCGNSTLARAFRYEIVPVAPVDPFGFR